MDLVERPDGKVFHSQTPRMPWEPEKRRRNPNEAAIMSLQSKTIHGDSKISGVKLLCRMTFSIQPGKPIFTACDDRSISVEWDAVPTVTYQLQYKEYPQPWEEAHTLEVPKGENKVTASVSDLQPCSTYNIRLVAVAEGGTESVIGPDIVIDTQAVSCTPKPKKGSCCIC